MAPLQQAEAVLGDAEAALSQLDVERFKLLLSTADAILPCIEVPVPTRLAANYHRVYGIDAVARRDPIAPRAFAAAKWLEPEYQFSKSLLNEGNPIREKYDAASAAQRATEPVERPETGAIYVDGAPSDNRPISWPAIVQWVDGTDQVQWTQYVLPGQNLPAYPGWTEAAPPERKPPAGLIAATAGAGVASAALYGVATLQEARYKDTVKNPVPDDKLNNLRRSTNTLVVASAVTATTAVGMGVAVVVAW